LESVLWYREIGLTEMILTGIFVVLYVLYIIRVARVARKFGTPYGTVFIKLILRTTYFLLFMVAILGPSFGGSKKEVKSIGKDIMICVDLSKSMDAFDIQPTRLEKTKYELKRLAAAFNSDRIGVIIFSSEAFMQCPLTYDQNALNLFIETMNTGLVPSSGTDFGPPMAMALSKLTDEKNSTAESKAKVILLISDGEDFGEDTDDVIKDIENKDINVFTLGIGTEKGGRIYAGNGIKKDRNGNVVVSRLNSSGLRSIANKTGGQYFEINETKNDVSRLINTIDKIEGEMRDARFVDVTANKYYYFLIAGLVLIAIDVLTNIKTVRI
jgi:Ca-activated chloride channel family protein